MRFASGCLAAMLILAGCGSTMPTPGLARGPIDEIHGAYDGVNLGASLNALSDQLGPPLQTNDDPYLTPAQLPPFVPANQPYDWVYPDADITFDDAHVASITVYGRGAATQRGVSIGDPLAEVPRVYGRARCVPGHGGPEPLDPGCEIQFGAQVYVYFAGNPIRAVTLSQFTELP